MFFKLTSTARHTTPAHSETATTAVSTKPQDESGSNLLYERIALSHALADIEENAHRKLRGK